MYSFWFPQAIYSAYTGTKHSFHPVYLIGVSLCHLFIPLYILGCPNNFLGLLSVYINPQYLAEMATEPDAHHSLLHQQPLSSVSACWVLVIWMTVQVGLLMLQTALGPRFFIPKKWLPSKYDYKRPIPAHLCTAFPASNISGGTSSSSSSSSSGDNSGNAGRNESVGDIAMTGIRSRSSASSPGGSNNNISGTSSSSGSRGSWASSYSGGLQALFGYGRINNNSNSNSNINNADGVYEVEMSDLETGRLLGDDNNGSYHNSNGNSGSRSSALTSSHVAAGTGTGTGGDINPGSMDCAICCNIIHFNSDDNLVSAHPFDRLV